jgi:hypothetical protein
MCVLIRLCVYMHMCVFTQLAMGVGGVAAASVMGVGVSQKADKLEALVFRGQF